MPLQEGRRAHLDEIVMKMRSNREPDSNIQFVVDDFKAKYENEGGATTPATPSRTGREAQGAFGEGADPGPAKSSMFPLASQVEGSGVGATAKRVGLGALDLMGAPTRAAGALRGMEMSDPDAYLLRPEVEAMKLDTTGESERSRAMMEAAARSGAPVAMPITPSMINAAVDFGGRVLSDPLTYLPGIGPLIQGGAKMVRGAGKGAGVVNKGAGRLAEEMSGVSEEALRKAGTKEGRAALEAAAGKEGEIGEEFLSYVENAEDYMPEKGRVEAALDRMEPIDLGSAVQAMERAKGPAVAGRLAPHKQAANTGIQKYIDFLRGGELPEDLAAGAQQARRAAGDASVDAAAAGAQAAVDARAAAQAAKAEKSAAYASRRAQPDPSYINRTGRDNEGWWWEETRKNAQDAAAKAKGAADEAKARAAIGEISQAEANAAQNAAEAAERGAQVAEVAARIHQGEKLPAIAKDLAGKGMGKDDLRDILKQAKTRVENQPPPPNQTVTAREYRDLRRDLDVPVDWQSEGAAVKNQALKAGRGTMKNELLRRAEESGIPEYAEDMKSWSNKLDKLDRLKEIIGKTGNVRDRRVEQFVNNLFGKNSRSKQRLMRDLDEIFGQQFTQRAKDAQLASQLGEGGTAGWLPRQFSGRALLGYGASSMMGTPLAAPLFASPKIASRVTLPALTKMEEGLKAAGVALTPKAQRVMAALKKPASDAQRARLASILAAELEAQARGNTAPFQIRRAETERESGE